MNQFLDVAIAAAREAGAVLLTEHSRPQKITYKGDVDLVTETDKRSEAIVVGRLRREFPDHRIVAEEGSGGATAASRYEWHVDVTVNTGDTVRYRKEYFTAGVAQ